MDADRDRGVLVVGEHPLPRVCSGSSGISAVGSSGSASCRLPPADRLAAGGHTEPPEQLAPRLPTRRRRRQRRAPRARPHAPAAAARGRRGRRTAVPPRPPRLGLADRLHVAEPDPHCALLDRALGARAVDVRRPNLHPAPLRIAHERRRRIEAHRLRVQERAEELARVVAPQPRRLVREQRERRRVRLRKAEPREADELVVDHVRDLLVDAVSEAPVDEARPKRLDRLFAPLAAHRAPQPFGLPDREAGRGHRRRRAPDPGRRRRRACRAAARAATRARPAARTHGSASRGARCSMYGCTAFPWIGPGRTSATCTVRSSRFSGRVCSRLCICARLSIWKTPTVSALLDLGVDRRVVERDARQVDRLAAQPRDAVDRVLDRREHAEPEQVDLQEAGVAAAVLVPLADLAARHRGRLHRHEVDQRARRDDHPARVLADVARQPGDLARQLAERVPARARCARPAAPSTSSATRVASQPSVTRASRSSSANGRPSALPTSRIAPRLR